MHKCLTDIQVLLRIVRSMNREYQAPEHIHNPEHKPQADRWRVMVHSTVAAELFRRVM